MSPAMIDDDDRPKKKITHDVGQRWLGAQIEAGLRSKIRGKGLASAASGSCAIQTQISAITIGYFCTQHAYRACRSD